ncbi:Rv1535 family protein [Mycobacterium talmoniae]|uniref:Uncharacterized protein n=1 Tax=Mycobacterium talmoniae TaxID=1858794 RepID=A0A1S1NLT6_9MYCO|nr:MULTISPECIES: Rv1535 family protein [Mycobacterium]OHV04170.1 hypothetical protein BKN37_11185 [Mycobacterium talmoniae]PQM46370.1 hypothetical protein C1Y40_03461 [Mycobacterium talmoniae]TDH56192.1 hypothetical protein E2F47_07985 [Mycobacterium eburneum]
MVAIAYTDISAPVQPVRPAKKALHKLDRQAVSTMSDPVVDMTTRLLSVPLHQLYALLWRVGVLSVDD